MAPAPVVRVSVPEGHALHRQAAEASVMYVAAVLCDALPDKIVNEETGEVEDVGGKPVPDPPRFIEVVHGGVNVEGGRAWWEYTFDKVRVEERGRFTLRMTVDRVVDNSRPIGGVRTEVFEVH